MDQLAETCWVQFLVVALASPRMVFLQACFVEPGAKPIKSGRQWARHGTALRRCQAPKGSDMIHSQICIYEIETISVPLSWSPRFQEISEEMIATLCMALFGLSASERCVLLVVSCSVSLRIAPTFGVPVPLVL